MNFSDGTWAQRYGAMGDASERKYEEAVEGRCVRWGINRPEGVHVPSLPSRVRAAPDYLTTEGFTECMGIGRKQHLRLKLEKHGVLHYWHQLMPVKLWIWDSHKKRSCLVSLETIDRLINTPDLCDVTYFDGRKLAFVIPAQPIFDAAASN